MTTSTPNHRWYHLTPGRFFVGVLAVQVFLLLSERFQWFAFNEKKGWAVVGYDYQQFEGSFFVTAKPPTPEWIRKLLGDDFFYDVVDVRGSPGFCNDDAIHLTGLPSVETLGLAGTQTSDAGLSHLKDLRCLRELSLGDTKVTGAGLEYLNGANLEVLDLRGSQVNDAGLEHVNRLTKLKMLALQDTQISDAGLQHLDGLVALERLSLNRTQVTDTGLESLTRLTNLQWLWLNRTQRTRRSHRTPGVAWKNRR